jgi:hypothetical protein
MPDAGVIASGGNLIDSSIMGIQVVSGLYGIGGIILIGLIAWILIYTYKVWPNRVQLKKDYNILSISIRDLSDQIKINTEVNNANAVKLIDLSNKLSILEKNVSGINLSVVEQKINDLSVKLNSVELKSNSIESKENSCRSNVESSLNQIHGTLDQFATSMQAFRESIEASVGKLDERLWDLKKR